MSRSHGPNRTPREWTSEELEALRQAWESRGQQRAFEFDREFAPTVQLRPGAVQTKRAKLGLSARNRKAKT